MADRARLETALRNAHAAGDAAAATRLAQALKAARGAPAAMSGGQFNERFEGDDPRNSIMGRIDAGVRGAADMATFGFADELAAGADALLQPVLGTGAPGGSFGERYAQNVEGQRRIDTSDIENRGGYRLAGQVAGAIAPAGLGARTVAGGASLGGKIVRGMVAGGAQGAAYGAGSAEGGLQPRAEGAAVGGAIGMGVGGAVPVVGNVVGKIVGGRAGRAAVPTTDALRGASSSLYRAAEAQGLRIAPQSFSTAVNAISRAVRAKGIDPNITPDSWAALGRLEQAVGGQLDLVEIDTLRQVLGAAAQSVKPKDRALASEMIGMLDDYMTNLTGRDVVAGNPQAAVGLIGQARTLWSRQAKGSIIETAFKNANDAATGLENGLRNEFRRLLKSPKYKWTDAERAALRRVVHGGLGANALRFLGAFGYSPDQARSFLGTVIGAGAGGALGGGVGAVALPAAGTAARLAGRQLTKGRADAASAIVRNGGVTPFNPAAAQSAGVLTNRTLGSLGQGVAVPAFLEFTRR